MLSYSFPVTLDADCLLEMSHPLHWQPDVVAVTLQQLSCFNHLTRQFGILKVKRYKNLGLNLADKDSLITEQNISCGVIIKKIFDF